jgi:hypothetical protein
MPLAGEWIPSNILFGAAFVFAGLLVVGLGAWVLSGDRRNRVVEPGANEERGTEHH